MYVKRMKSADTGRVEVLRGSRRSAQADVDRLKAWSDKWLTEFNAKERIPGT